MRKRILWGLVLLGLAALGSAQAQRRPTEELPAHRWPREERIERRLNPTAVQERITRAVEEGQLSRQRLDGSVYIDGARNPELLLPWEILQQLTMQGLVAAEPARSGYREMLEDTRQRLDLPESFWSDLEQVTQPFVSSLRAQVALARQAHFSTAVSLRQLEALQSHDCQLRARALAEARHRFGRELFDKFLYQSVAPTMTIVAEQNDNESYRLSWVEEGCK